MIRSFFIGCLLVPVVFAFSNEAINWQSLGGIQGSSASVEVIEASMGSMVVNITVPGFYMYDYPAGGFVFDRIELPGFYNQSDVGLPELPSVVSLFALPFGADAQITIEQIEVSEFSGINVLPAQEPEIDMPHTPFPFRMNEDYYSSERVFPAEYATVDNEGIWSGVRVARLVVNPFSYNPETGTLNVIQSIRVRVDFVGATAESFLVPSERLAMFRTTLLNFDSLDFLFDTGSGLDDPTDPAEYIVVANADNVDEAADLFMLHNSLGLKTVVEILPNPATQSQIEAAIDDNYETGVTRFALIVGDDIAMPLHLYGSDPGDYYYACITEGDEFADIAVGRLTGDETQIAHQVDKIINGYMTYSWDDGNETGIIPSEAVLAAHEQNYPLKYTECCDSIAAYPYSLCNMTFTKVYPPEGGTAADVSNAINTGMGTVTYRGHGSTTAWTWSPGWTKTNIDALTNTFMPHVFNIACNNGELQSGECLCESWQWATNGASGNLGASTGSWTIPNHDYIKQTYIALYDIGLFRIGEAIMYATEWIIINHPDLGLDNARIYIWFGDPAVDTWTFDTASEPLALLVDAPDFVYPGAQTIDITVTESGSPVENAAVTLTDGVEGYDAVTIYEEGLTDASGEVSFSVDVPTSGIITAGAFLHDYEFDIKDIVVTVGIEGGEPVVGNFGLLMPVPNPVTTTANISFNLPVGGNCELAVFDVVGRKVDTISSGEMPAGAHSLVWQPDELASGVYFLRLTSGAETATHQVMVIR